MRRRDVGGTNLAYRAEFTKPKVAHEGRAPLGDSVRLLAVGHRGQAGEQFAGVAAVDRFRGALGAVARIGG